MRTFRRALTPAGHEPASRVAALLGIDAVFGRDLAASDPFRLAVIDAYAQLTTRGARSAIAGKQSES